MEKVHISRFKP